MEKTSPLDKLTILGLGRKMDKIKELANDAVNKEIDVHTKEQELYNVYSPDDHWIQMDDTGEVMDGVGDEVDKALQSWIGHQEGYKQAMQDILDIVDPHRHKLKDKKKVLDLLDFKEHLNKLKENK